MNLQLPRLDPDLAYLSTSLFLPKKHIEEEPVRAALTYGIGDEERQLVLNHPHHLEVPRSFLTPAQLDELELEVVDLRPKKFESIGLRPKWTFQLRPDQEPAWKALKKADDGILVLSCGKGKTLMAWRKAAYEDGPVLFVSWQKAHLANAEAELRKWFDYSGEIGWIAGNEMEYDKGIVLCTIQTLAGRVESGRLPPDFSSRFALIIFDECHHLAAEWFSVGADACSGKRLGLTATENRVDRNEGIFLNHLGPVFYKDISQDIAPTFYIVDTGVEVTEEDEKEFLDVTGQRNTPLIRSWLGRNEHRNSVIRLVMDELLSQGRVPYALSHSVHQTEVMHESYPQSGLITGKVKKADERLRQLQTFIPVFATMGVGAESYNRSDLDSLLLMTPFAARDYAAPAFQQSVGRIQRKWPGKEDAEVYLFLDREIEESAGMTFSLVKEAKRQGFEVKTWRPKGRRHRPASSSPT